MILRTYKFLAKGAIGPISGFAWPQPNTHVKAEWLEATGALEPCVCGAHVCRPEDLAYWIHEELWETEVEGESITGFDCLVARRARLVRRFDDWHNGAAARFAVACADHAAEVVAASSSDVRDFIDDARECARYGLAACGAFSAALAVAKAADAAVAKRVFRDERSWQAGWITRNVIGN
jgi:hypothetical protein